MPRSVRSLTSRSVAAFLVAGLGCADEPATPILDTQIITPSGESPFALDTDFDRLRIVWDQGSGTPMVQEIALDEEDFEVPFARLDDVPSRIRVELSSPTETHVGAPPEFYPSSARTLGTWLLRIVVGRPGTCSVALPYEPGGAPRSDSAHVRWGPYAFHLGGRTAEGPTGRVTFSDHLWVTGNTDVGAFAEPVGRAKGVRVGNSGTFIPFAVILAESGNFAYALRASSAEQSAPITLYEGAGLSSAIARREINGDALVAGGIREGAPVATTARVTTDGTITRGELMAPRAGASAHQLAGGVLVAGGDRREGAPFAEWIDLATLVPTPIDDAAAEPVRNDPVVVEGATSAWVLGGTDAAGVPLTTSWVIRGCPRACTMAPGPEVTLGLSPTAEGAVLVDERMVWRAVEAGEAGGWSLELVAELRHTRRRPGVVVYESGMVWVHGGSNDEGPRGDVELCYPPELTPLL